MTEPLRGKQFAILVTDGFEQSELMEPKRALEQAGARTQIVSPTPGQVKGWKDKDWGDAFPVDVTLNRANVEDYDGLLLPGGVMNPDKLRMIPEAVQFVRSFFDAGKPIAAICHGPWTLVEADVVRGLMLTSWPSLKTDIGNAGGNWIDEEVAADKGIVTSRKPDDIPAFNRKMIEEFAEGIHTGRRGAQTSDTGLSHMAFDQDFGEIPIAEHLGRGDQRPMDVGAAPDIEYDVSRSEPRANG